MGGVLFPSFTVRSSGGFRGPLLLLLGLGISDRGVEPVNHTSGRALVLGLMVARCLELSIPENLKVCPPPQRGLIEESFGTLRAAGRKKIEGADISLGRLLSLPETSRIGLQRQF